MLKKCVRCNNERTEKKRMIKERDQALNANIESIFDNSNLKADIKKFEDQEALRGQK